MRDTLSPARSLCTRTFLVEPIFQEERMAGKRDVAAGKSPLSPLIVEWKKTQSELRKRLIIGPLHPLPQFVAGVDAAFSSDKKHVYAAAVVYDRMTQKIIDIAHARRAAEFPYIPGFLSFREGPAVREAIRALTHPFGVICFDGQGYAHPRRCGLASHVAIELDVPSVGVAKSRFIGTHDEPEPQAGSDVPLMDRDEQIGLVLRTRDHTRPVYISIGHRVDLASAKQLAMACVTRYRIPEPTRNADIEVAKLKRKYEGTG
jgi:deoxyribonuclease V